ncbi:MAG TPA: hypothetical protein VJ724_14765, partial [Tahibacter sp.]|nr:hypothetical protein [Tahibacter sp.]
GAGRNLMNGFRTAWSGSGVDGVGGNMFGHYVTDGGVTSWTPTTFGNVVNVAGGIYAGYNRFQGSNGGLAGGLGAATYGIGTMGVAGGLASMAAGGGFAAGFGGAMGAVGMLPVVGWIAAIAMLVDMLAGGKLFGTNFRTQYMDSSLNIGADGASASLTETRVRQRSLFRGRQWETREVAPTPEMEEAAREFWQQMADTSKDVARALGTEVAPVIEASLRTVTEYDKKGREKATKYLVEAIGRTWEEATQELAAKRIAAEQMIASIDFGQPNAEASAIAEQYRDDAEALADAAATMVQASADLRDEKSLLGGGDTLTSIMAWVEEQRRGSEDLSQTYARLSQATQQYNEILRQVDDALAQLRIGAGPVEQMKAALENIDKQLEQTIEALDEAAIAAGLTAAREEDLARARELAAEQINRMAESFNASIDDQLAAFTASATPAGDFARTMRMISRTMQENIAQANMLARAQGQAGASTQTLARIHELAARQAAGAIQRLIEIGQQQSRSLYGGAFTLDQVNADIAELESRANAANGAVRDFGGAMGDAAQAATDAMNLLLGDLSPLNDQEKLQAALAGLRAGTVTQEQVLEIGRRLYASSSQYSDLFRVVQGMGGGAGGGASVGGGAAQQGPVFTQEDRERLLGLYEQREQLAREQRQREARDLAATIATLARAQEITFDEAAEIFNVNLEDLAEDLGLQSVEELDKYLDAIDVSTSDVTDSFTTNTDRIIDTMERLWGYRDESAVDGEKSKAVKPESMSAQELVVSRDEARRSSREQVRELERVREAIERVGASIDRNADNAPRSTRYSNTVLK